MTRKANIKVRRTIRFLKKHGSHAAETRRGARRAARQHQKENRTIDRLLGKRT